MSYAIAEIFYSLKGEGRWTGHPMVFIRLAGCNQECSWCDTDHNITKVLSAEDILSYVNQYPTNRVVITGGEPLLQDLSPLLKELHLNDKHIHLETNGTIRIPAEYHFDWIAVSPKHDSVHNVVLCRADEVKFLCGAEFPGWFDYMARYKRWAGRHRLLMPIDYKDSLHDNTILAIQACLEDGGLSLCMQMHKIWRIK